MRAWVAVVCVGAFAVGAVAQPPEGAPPVPAPTQPGDAKTATVVIAHQFKKGDRFELDIVKSREASGRRPARAVKTHVEVEILDVQETGAATIAWTNKLSQVQKDAIEEAKTPLELQAAAVMQAADGLRMEFDLDEVGEIAGLRNFEDVKQLVDKALGLAEAQLKERGLPEAQIKSAMDLARGQFADEDRAAAVMLTEPTIYFQAYGYELTPGEPVTADVELANAFGGPMFPGEMTMELVEYDAEAPKIRMSGLQRIKPEEGKTAVVETAKLIAERMGKPIPKEGEAEMAEANLTMNDETTYTIDRATGVVEFAKFVRSVTFGESKRREETVIKLVKARAKPGK